MINKKHSFKDFTHKTFLDADPREFSGIIRGSCFSREKFEKPFPDGAVIHFLHCNTYNCDLSNITATFEGGCTGRYAVQNDREDWITDDDGRPLEPMGKKLYLRLGLSIEPRHIPNKMQSVHRAQEVERQLNG